MLEERVLITFIDKNKGKSTELEVPLSITANDLIIAVNAAFSLGMDIENIFGCYLASNEPIALLRGDNTLESYGIRNGSVIIYQEK